VHLAFALYQQFNSIFDINNSIVGGHVSLISRIALLISIMQLLISAIAIVDINNGRALMISIIHIMDIIYIIDINIFFIHLTLKRPIGASATVNRTTSFRNNTSRYHQQIRGVVWSCQLTSKTWVQPLEFRCYRV